MSANVVPFRFEMQEVRVVMREGEPWFVAKDVCEALDYTWTGTQRIKHVPEQWRGVTSVVTPSGEQEMAALSEQGLYFFLGRSDKPKALPLQMFVAGDVLPSIRKTGGYGIEKPGDWQRAILEQLAAISVHLTGEVTDIKVEQKRQGDEQKRQGERIDHIESAVTDLVRDVKLRRREISDSTKREHKRILSLQGNRCPHCRQPVVDVEFDHAEGSNRPDFKHTWPLCKPCHFDITNGRVSRLDMRPSFEAYQAFSARNPHPNDPVRQMSLVINL